MADDAIDATGVEPPLVVRPRPVATPGVSTQPAPSFGEVLGAQFDYNNLLGSLASSKSLREGLFGQTSTPITDDELNKRIKDDGLQDYVNRFVDVQSKEQYDALRSDILRELDDKRILAEAPMGTSLLTGAIATTLDLPTLIPVGKAVQLGRAAEEAFSLARTTGQIAVASGVDSGIREAGLHATEQTRTGEESALNIGSSILFATAVGVPIARVTNALQARTVGEALKRDADGLADGTVETNANKLIGQVQRDLEVGKGELVPVEGEARQLSKAEGDLPPPPTNPNDSTAISTEVRDNIGRAGDWMATGNNMTAEQSEVAKDFGITKAAKKVNDWLGGNIVMDMRASPFKTARDFISNLTPSPVMLKGNFEGMNTPQSAKALTARMEGIKNTSTREFINHYKAFRKGIDLRGKDLARFSRLVTMALANDDKAPAWMAVNDRADIAGAYERTANFPPGTFSRELSSPERQAIESAAKAVRTYFTETANYNIRAGLMRGYDSFLDAVKKSTPNIDNQFDALNGPKVPGSPRGGKSPIGTLENRQGRIGGPDMSAPQIGVRQDLRARVDSPENLSVEDFISEVRKGKLGATREAAPRGPINKRSGLYGELHLLQYVDTLLGEGKTKSDIAREFAHSWAMAYDRNYREKYAAYAKDRLFRKYAGQKLSPDVRAQILDELFQGDITSFDKWRAELHQYRKDAKLKAPKPPTLTDALLKRAHEDLVQQRADYAANPLGETGEIQSPEQTSTAGGPTPSKGELSTQVEAPQARDLSKLGRFVDPGEALKSAVEPQSYLKHIFTERVMHDQSEFIRTEARAWIENWERVNNRPFAALRMRDKRLLFNKAAKHASGAFRAIVHGSDSEGQIAGGNLRNMGNRRGSVLDRNVMMTSKELLRRGWIEDDVLRLMDVSFRQNVTDAALAMRFRRPPTDKEINAALRNQHDAYWIDGEDPTSVPDLAMTEPKRLLQEEGERAFQAARTDDERSKIKAEIAAQHKNIDDAVNILRGRYEPQSQFTAGARRLAFLRDFVFATRLNNFLTSSLPDVGTVIMEHGPGRVAGFMAKRALTNFKELASLNLSDRSVFRLRRDARAAAVAGEHENMGRIASMVDVSDPYSGYASSSTMMRGLKNMTHTAAKVQGIPYWNSWLQRVSYGIFQDRVIEAALHPNKLNKDDITWLAHHGINDREFLDAVKANYLKQDPKYALVDGLHNADHESWDLHTQERFLAAARDSARNSVITPEALEKPRAMHKPGGASLLQFMAYTIVSTHRVTAGAATRIRNGTNADMARVGSGLGTMMAAAALGIYLRAYATGQLDKLPDWDEHKGWWMWEVLDRSGVFGLFSNLDDMIESTGIPGARRAAQVLAGDSDRRIGTTARSIPRTIAESIEGPAAPTINDFGSIAKDSALSLWRQFDDQVPYNQGIRARTVHSAINSTPIANAALLRLLGVTDAAEQYIDEDILGVPYDGK